MFSHERFRQFNALFEVEENNSVDGDDVEFDQTKLDALEEQWKTI